jgi:hypothetical protein
MSGVPYLMRVRVSGENRGVNLWLPLFIIFPIVAVILLVLSPLMLLAAIILWPFGWGKTLVAIIPAVASCICAMRGLQVDVEDGREKVNIWVK